MFQQQMLTFNAAPKIPRQMTQIERCSGKKMEEEKVVEANEPELINFDDVQSMFSGAPLQTVVDMKIEEEPKPVVEAIKEVVKEPVIAPVPVQSQPAE